MATERYSHDILLEEDHMHHEEAVQSTCDAINDHPAGVFFLAAYIKDGVRVRVNILERVPAECWNLIEVKFFT